MSKRITSVTVENFKGQSRTITLTGKDYITGPTGAGKTTVLDAIQLAILGYHPRQDKKPMAIMKAFASGSPCTVAIECENGLKVTRIFEQKGDKFSQDMEIYPSYQEKNLIAKNARIAEEFGNFTVMFDLSEFLAMSSDKQRDFVFRYLPSVGWDRKKAMHTIMGEWDTTSLTINQATIDKAFACWREGTDVQMGLGNVIAYVKDQISFLTKKLKESEAASRQITTIKNQQKAFSISLIERLKAEIKESREELTTLEKELATIAERNRNITTQRDKATRTLQGIETEIKQNKLDREPIEAALKEAQQELETMTIPDATETRKQYDAAVSRKNEVQADRNALAREISQIESLLKEVSKATCPIIKDRCNQDFTGFIEKKRADIAELQKSLVQKDEKIAEAQKDIEAVKVILDRIDEDRKAREALEKWIREAEGALKTLSDAEVLLTEIAGLGEPVDTTTIEAGIAELRISIDQKDAQVKEADKQKNTLSNLEFTLTSRKEAETELQEYKTLSALLGPKGLQGRIVKESLSPMLEDINALMSQIDRTKQFYIELTDGQDKEIFEIMCKKADGSIVPVTSLSSGESVVGYAALIASFIKLGNPPGKYLLIDNIEHVSNEGEPYRDNFIAGLNRIAGDFDNIIVCGTVGIKEVPEGWNVTNFYEVTV